MEVLRNHSVDAGEFQSCGFLGINESTESTKSRNRGNPKYQLHKTPSYVKGALFKLNRARFLCHSFNPPYVFSFFFMDQDAQKACSCYTFENGTGHGMSWQEANKSCRLNKNHLLVLETLREWEFINKTMKDRTGVKYPEWHIGLFKNITTGKWTWINGKPLSIKKWQRNEPNNGDKYALIHKNWPSGSYGSLSGSHVRMSRGWICEKETGLNMLRCLRYVTFFHALFFHTCRTRTRKKALDPLQLPAPVPPPPRSVLLNFRSFVFIIIS